MTLTALRSAAPEFSLRFDKKDGLITSYRYKGVDLLERGPRPDFWRAPTNNDRGGWKDLNGRGPAPRSRDYRVWKDAGPLWQVKDVHVDKVDSATARIVVNADLPGVCVYLFRHLYRS